MTTNTPGRTEWSVPLFIGLQRAIAGFVKFIGRCRLLYNNTLSSSVDARQRFIVVYYLSLQLVIDLGVNGHLLVKISQHAVSHEIHNTCPISCIFNSCLPLCQSRFRITSNLTRTSLTLLLANQLASYIQQYCFSITIAS